MLDAYEAELALAPRARVLEDHRDVCVARCVLGLTVYPKHEPTTAAGVARILRCFIETLAADRSLWFHTSLRPARSRIAARTLATVVDELANTAGNRPRHLFALDLADSEHAPSWFFR